MYGINANYEATAASQGVPLDSNQKSTSHDQDIADAAKNPSTKLDKDHKKEPYNDVTEDKSSSSDGVDVEKDAGKTSRSASLNDEVEKKSSSPADTLENNSDHKAERDAAPSMERRQSVVQALARSYSRASGANGESPFAAGPDSPLNPASPHFSGRQWAKAIAELIHQEGSDFRSAGVCFQHMNVHGFGASSDYQKDVANVWLSVANLFRRGTNSSHRRIDILRDFDGLVRTGEMLVVLGPPGSGCSTFLKTIAGEMNGIYVDKASYFNYKGKQAQCQGRC